jgi:hypothetical protein
MKKLSLAILLCTISMLSFSQANENEKKLGVRELPTELLQPRSFERATALDCRCNGQFIKDPGFSTVTTYPGSSNIAPSSTPWHPGDATPQYSPAAGACDNGFISMWGNKTVGESIYQNGLSLVKGKCYKIKFNGRFLNGNALNTFVQLAVNGTTGTPPSPIRAVAGAVNSPSITSTAWQTYTMTYTPTSNVSTLSLYPVNGNAQNNGNYVSWIQIDNFCIEECCQCSLQQNPPIQTSAKMFCACDPISFSTTNCPGATYSWTVTDDKGNTITVAGNGTSAITLNYTLAQQIASMATGFVVTVKISCGGETVTNTIKPALKPIPKTNISFSLSDDGAGHYTATATSLATGNGNGWTLKEVNCPGPNPCNWVAGGIKWQSTGNTINIPNGVLVKGKCYVLTHYVNVCSPVWIAGPCTVYKATCFKLDGNSMMRLVSRDTDKNDALQLLPEMTKEIEQLKAGNIPGLN